jgi:hypothetical protein
MKLKRALLSTAIVAALGGSAVANAQFVSQPILFDPNGVPGGAISIANMGWNDATGFFDDFVTSTVGALGGVTNAANDPFTVYLQANLGSFALAAGGSASPVAGTEFTYQLALSLSPDSLTSTSLSATNISAGGANVFKIWYDATADSGNEFATLSGTGYGPDYSAIGSSCDVAANNAASTDGSILILCGTITDVDNTLAANTSVTLTGGAETLSALDTTGNSGGGTGNDDNYNGVDDLVDGPDAGTTPDSTWDDTLDVGTTKTTGGFNFDIDVVYANPLFFLSNITAMAVDANLDGNSETPFNDAQPSSKVFGESWDVGIDTEDINPGVGVDTRFINDLDCIDGNDGAVAGTSYTCDFVFEHTSTASFAPTVPEPTSLALLGLGLASFGVYRRRR